MPETPDERLNRIRAELQQRALVFKALIDRFGPGVLDVVKQNTIDNARAGFAQMSLPQRELNAVMTLLWNNIGSDLDFTVEAQTPTHLEFKVTRCIWADEMRKLGAAETGYAFHYVWDVGFCQGLNPAIRFTRTKTLMQGDDCCNHTYDLETPDAARGTR